MASGFPGTVDCVQAWLLWPADRLILLILIQQILLTGPTATGKSSLPRELAGYLGAMYRVSGFWASSFQRLVAQCATLQVKNGSPDVTINSFTGFLKVVMIKMTMRRQRR